MNISLFRDDFLPAGFPTGVRVLAVDDDPISLQSLERMLCRCNYKVTATVRHAEIPDILRDEKNGFDIILCDVKKSNLDGLKHLEHIIAEKHIPVVLISSQSDTELVMAGIEHGAVHYLMKPIRMEDIKLIWQHVYRMFKLNSVAIKNATDSNMASTSNLVNLSSNENETATVIKDQGRDMEEHGDDHDHNDNLEGQSSSKKARLTWSSEREAKFVEAVNRLEIDGKKAVPKRILELMGDIDISRDQVASHLQKYRKKKLPNKPADSYQTNDTSYLQMNQRVNGISGEIRPATELSGSSFSTPSFSTSHYTRRLDIRDRRTDVQVNQPYSLVGNNFQDSHSLVCENSLMANQTGLSGGSSNPFLDRLSTPSMLHGNTQIATIRSGFVGQSSNSQCPLFGCQSLGDPSSAQVLPLHNGPHVLPFGQSLVHPNLPLDRGLSSSLVLPIYTGQYSRHVPLGQYFVPPLGESFVPPVYSGLSSSNVLRKFEQHDVTLATEHQVMLEPNTTTMGNGFVGEQYQDEYNSVLGTIDSNIVINASISQQQPPYLGGQYYAEGETENAGIYNSTTFLEYGSIPLMEANENEKSDEPESEDVHDDLTRSKENC